ncbi:hypothetical protein M0804_001814 [Polistes exclamans]|nr:hypothetical protein M0804_001814 [Polistes exclamans]
MLNDVGHVQRIRNQFRSSSLEFQDVLARWLFGWLVGWLVGRSAWCATFLDVVRLNLVLVRCHLDEVEGGMRRRNP